MTRTADQPIAIIYNDIKYQFDSSTNIKAAVEQIFSQNFDTKSNIIHDFAIRLGDINLKRFNPTIIDLTQIPKCGTTVLDYFQKDQNITTTNRNNTINIDSRFGISFCRTIRIPNNETIFTLPPNLGLFDINNSSDNDEYQICMHDSEAMWINFTNLQHCDYAVKINAGSLNVVSGSIESETDGLKSNPQNYVTNQQPWLDGFKSPNCDQIKQFTAIPVTNPESLESQLYSMGLTSELKSTLTFKIFKTKTIPKIMYKRNGLLQPFPISAIHMQASDINLGGTLVGYNEGYVFSDYTFADYGLSAETLNLEIDVSKPGYLYARISDTNHVYVEYAPSEKIGTILTRLNRNLDIKPIKSKIHPGHLAKLGIFDPTLVTMIHRAKYVDLDKSAETQGIDHLSTIFVQPRLYGGGSTITENYNKQSLTAGGSISQKIYADTIDQRMYMQIAQFSVQIINATKWKELTGKEPKQTLITYDKYKKYKLPWFKLDDMHIKSVPTTSTNMLNELV